MPLLGHRLKVAPGQGGSAVFLKQMGVQNLRKNGPSSTSPVLQGFPAVTQHSIRVLVFQCSCFGEFVTGIEGEKPHYGVPANTPGKIQ